MLFAESQMIVETEVGEHVWKNEGVRMNAENVNIIN